MNVSEAIEATDRVNKILDDLFLTLKKDQVESVFSENNIADKADRIKLLRRCMHVLGTSDVSNELSIDDEYSDELEIFLTGKWRFLI